MKHNRHQIADMSLERQMRGDEFAREYSVFSSLYRRRKYESAEVVLDKLFVLAYERFPSEVFALLLAEAAVKAECGELMKSIRLNRALLAELRNGDEVSDIERIASENLITDLNAFGYNVGGVTEASVMIQREMLSFQRKCFR